MNDEEQRQPSALWLVAEFYRLVGRQIRPHPTADLPEDEITQLVSLLDEEVGELRNALLHRDLVKIADGLGDVCYVLSGAALQFGIDLERVIAAVHEANMTKPNSDGTVKRARDGKILRGDSYRPPSLDSALGIREATGSDGRKDTFE